MSIHLRTKRSLIEFHHSYRIADGPQCMVNQSRSLPKKAISAFDDRAFEPSTNGMNLQEN